MFRLGFYHPGLKEISEGICSEYLDNVLSLGIVIRARNIIVSPILLILSVVALGQDAAKTDSEAPQLLENIHLHLNKTAFFKGEHLWFKAYVKDQRQHLPSSTTTNLHVGIFSKEGKALQKKMLLVNNGISYGDFSIDSTFVEDSYTLMAWTNYIKNFESPTTFLQQIKIVGKTKQMSQSKGDLTILVHPEGQQIIADAYNSVGFTVVDGHRRPIQTNDIYLLTESGKQIQSDIQTNELGQGRFGFFADPNESYFLKIKGIKGLWTTHQLEIEPHQGIGISVDNTAKEVVVIHPKRSKPSLHVKDGTKFSMAIFNHTEGAYMHRYEIDPNNTPISIGRNQIPSGINTAVILDEDMSPVSQRMFFNKQSLDIKPHSVNISYCLTQNQDSLQIDLMLPEGNEQANLSISVLPVESRAYYPNNTISSSFWVQPYLQQQFVDGRYFFEGADRSRDYQMDTRLLMEGSQKFGELMGKDLNENITYEFEESIAFSGKILDADLKSEKQVSIMSQTFGTVNFFDLSSNKNFGGRLPLFENDSVLVSVLDEKGKLRKPKAELNFDNHRLDTFDYSKWLAKESQIEQEPALFKIGEDLDLTDRTISLDEVVVSEKIKENTKFQITTEIEARIIDKTALTQHNSFISYIQKLGFQIRPNVQEGGIAVYVFNPPGIARVPVSIGGVPANPGELVSMPLSSIASIVYNKYVMPHQGPFIALSLRYDYDELYGREARFTSFAIPKGFNRPQAYFTPNYPDYSSFLYKRYGAIWWESQVKVSSEIPHSITVPLNEQQEVKVIIEGMSTQGMLYHTEQTCSPFVNVESSNEQD